MTLREEILNEAIFKRQGRKEDASDRRGAAIKALGSCISELSLARKYQDVGMFLGSLNPGDYLELLNYLADSILEYKKAYKRKNLEKQFDEAGLKLKDY